MYSLTLHAPAKINPRLKITGLRANGFHELNMIMVPLKFADEITLRELPSQIELQLSGDVNPNDANVLGEKNLAWRAAKLFREHFQITQGVRISLTKKIPSGAGLGGGSSDAATVLLGLNQLWKVGASVQELSKLASQLGSDVPFFCSESACWVGGVGDQVELLSNYPNFHVLLLKPPFSVATPWAYQSFDRSHALKAPETGVFQLTVPDPGVRGSTLFSSVAAVVQALENDLETVVFTAHPELAKLKSQLVEFGALGSLMSGSGSVVFGIFSDHASLTKAEKAFAGGTHQVIATQTISGKNACV